MMQVNTWGAIYENERKKKKRSPNLNILHLHETHYYNNIICPRLGEWEMWWPGALMIWRAAGNNLHDHICSQVTEFFHVAFNSKCLFLVYFPPTLAFTWLGFTVSVIYANLTHTWPENLKVIQCQPEWNTQERYRCRNMLVSVQKYLHVN